MSQGGNIGRRDVGDFPDTGSKLNDMQNAIETLTHSVNHMATKQKVRGIIVSSFNMFIFSSIVIFTSQKVL